MSRVGSLDFLDLKVNGSPGDRARIELVTPGSAVRCPSVVRHVTDCHTRTRYRVVSFYFSMEVIGPSIMVLFSMHYYLLIHLKMA